MKPKRCYICDGRFVPGKVAIPFAGKVSHLECEPDPGHYTTTTVLPDGRLRWSSEASHPGTIYPRAVVEVVPSEQLTDLPHHHLIQWKLDMEEVEWVLVYQPTGEVIGKAFVTQDANQWMAIPYNTHAHPELFRTDREAFRYVAENSAPTFEDEDDQHEVALQIGHYQGYEHPDGKIRLYPPQGD